jgi:hypothetical protein
MKHIKLSLLFLLIVGFIACKKSKTDANSEVQQKAHYEKVYNTCDSLQEVTEQDTGEIHKNELGRKMEHAMCEKAKLMRGLSNEDKLLVEYDGAKDLLIRISKKGKEHPELYKDEKFIKTANDKMEKVREYYGLLKKASLNSDQRKRFYEITKREL